jgi:hypothetical protein
MVAELARQDKRRSGGVARGVHCGAADEGEGFRDDDEGGAEWPSLPIRADQKGVSGAGIRK